MLHIKQNVAKIIFTFFALHFVAGSKKGKSEYVNEFVNELHNNIAAAEICEKNMSNTNFGVFHFAGEDIEAGNFFGLYEDLCKTSRPEVITIITVTKYYTEEKDVEGSGNMVKLISGLQKFLKYGNENDIYKTSFGVTVHRVKNKYIKDIDTTAANIKKIKMINQKLDSESKKHSIRYMCEALLKAIVSNSLKSLALTIYNQDQHNENTQQLKTDELQSYFDGYCGFFKSNISFKYIDHLSKECYFNATDRSQSHRDAYTKILTYEERIQFEYFTGKKDKFIKAFDVALDGEHNESFLCIRDEIMPLLTSIFSNEKNLVEFKNVFMATYESMKTESKYVYDSTKERLTFKIFYRYFRKNIGANPFIPVIKQIFTENKVFEKIAEIINKSKARKRTEQNSKLFFGKSTKIILHEELTPDSLWHVCQIINNIDIFARFNENQLFYIDTVNAMNYYTILANVSGYRNNNSSLFKNTQHYCSNGGTLKIFTAKIIDQKQSKSIIKKLISLKYNKRGIIEKLSMQDTAIKKRLKRNVSVKCIEKKDHVTNDKAINAMFDKCLAKDKNKPDCMVEITLKNNINDKYDARIYIMLHSNIGFKFETITMILNVHNSAIIRLDSKAEDSQRQIKCFNSAHIPFLKDLITNIQLTQLTPTKFTIPNLLSSKHADFFYAEKLISHKLPDFRLFLRFARENLNYYTNSVGANLFNMKQIVEKETLHSKMYGYEPKILKNFIEKREIYNTIFENFILNKRYKYGLANNTFDFKRNYQNDEFVMIVFRYRKMYVVQIWRKKQKLYSMQYFWNTPIEVLTTLLKSQDNRMMSDQIDLLQGLISTDLNLCTIIVNNLLQEMFFDKNHLKINSKDRKKYSDKMTMVMKKMMECSRPRKTSADYQEASHACSLPSVPNQSELVSGIKRFVVHILNTIDKLIKVEENLLTTIVVYEEGFTDSFKTTLASDNLIKHIEYVDLSEFRCVENEFKQAIDDIDLQYNKKRD